MELSYEMGVDPVSMAIVCLEPDKQEIRNEVNKVGAHTELDRLFFENVQPSKVRLVYVKSLEILDQARYGSDV
jgi:hypothetical protein